MWGTGPTSWSPSAHLSAGAQLLPGGGKPDAAGVLQSGAGRQGCRPFLEKAYLQNHLQTGQPHPRSVQSCGLLPGAAPQLICQAKGPRRFWVTAGGVGERLAVLDKSWTYGIRHSVLFLSCQTASLGEVYGLLQASGCCAIRFIWLLKGSGGDPWKEHGEEAKCLEPGNGCSPPGSAPAFPRTWAKPPFSSFPQGHR